MNMKQLRAIRAKKQEIKALEVDVKKMETIAWAIPKVHEVYTYVREKFLEKIVNAIALGEASPVEFFCRTIFSGDMTFGKYVTGSLLQYEFENVLSYFFNEEDYKSYFIAYKVAGVSDANLKEFLSDLKTHEIDIHLCLKIAISRVFADLQDLGFGFSSTFDGFHVEYFYVSFDNVPDNADLTLSVPLQSTDPANMVDDLESLQKRITALKPKVNDLLVKYPAFVRKSA